MKKTKSKAAYTNIWLNRNKHLWTEYNIYFQIKESLPTIHLRENSAPKIVVERVKEINAKRSAINRILYRKYKIQKMIKNKRRHPLRMSRADTLK